MQHVIHFKSTRVKLAESNGCRRLDRRFYHEKGIAASAYRVACSHTFYRLWTLSVPTSCICFACIASLSIRWQTVGFWVSFIQAGI